MEEGREHRDERERVRKEGGGGRRRNKVCEARKHLHHSQRTAQLISQFRHGISLGTHTGREREVGQGGGGTKVLGRGYIGGGGHFHKHTQGVCCCLYLLLEDKTGEESHALFHCEVIEGSIEHQLCE